MTKSAPSADIKKAYRKLVRKRHPDLHPDDAGAEAAGIVSFQAGTKVWIACGVPDIRQPHDDPVT
ncbi:MAG: DnaJ domain-containing protein [Loktanella sp.]|nr:DnaJ domain-containing protein [Loktanella sp.]